MAYQFGTEIYYVRVYATRVSLSTAIIGLEIYLRIDPGRSHRQFDYQP